MGKFVLYVIIPIFALIIWGERANQMTIKNKKVKCVSICGEYESFIENTWKESACYCNLAGVYQIKGFVK